MRTHVRFVGVIVAVPITSLPLASHSHVVNHVLVEVTDIDVVCLKPTAILSHLDT